AALQNFPTQPREAMNSPSPGGPEEAEEVGSDDVVDVASPSQTGLPISILDPWLSQVVHGYCPPEGTQFSRPTPPTTMPPPRPPPCPAAPRARPRPSPEPPSALPSSSAPGLFPVRTATGRGPVVSSPRIR